VALDKTAAGEVSSRQNGFAPTIAKAKDQSITPGLSIKMHFFTPTEKNIIGHYIFSSKG